MRATAVHDALLPAKRAPRETQPLYATPAELEAWRSGGLQGLGECTAAADDRQRRCEERRTQTALRRAEATLARVLGMEAQMKTQAARMDLLEQRLLGLVRCGERRSELKISFYREEVANGTA